MPRNASASANARPGQRQAADAPPAAVDGHAHGRGHEDQGPAGQHRLWIEVGREEHGDDVDEHAHRQRDEEEDDQVEQRLAAGADEVLRHLPERHATRARMDTTSAPKSCTAPTKMAPTTTHNIAGSQPQMTAMAGPSIGDSPVIDAYWWPNST